MNWGTKRLSVWTHAIKQISYRDNSQTLFICTLATRFLVVFYSLTWIVQTFSKKKKLKTEADHKILGNHIKDNKYIYRWVFGANQPTNFSVGYAIDSRLRNWNIKSWALLGPQSISCYQWSFWKWGNGH